MIGTSPYKSYTDHQMAFRHRASVTSENLSTNLTLAWQIGSQLSLEP